MFPEVSNKHLFYKHKDWCLKLYSVRITTIVECGEKFGDWEMLMLMNFVFFSTELKLRVMAG